MDEHVCKPDTLPAGFYWFMERDAAPVVVEKRDGEKFVRHTNGRRSSWIASGEKFIGPLMPPNVPSERGENER